MTDNVLSLAADTDLRPEIAHIEIDGEVQPFLNVDALVKLMRDTDTPATRAYYRQYRKRKATLKRDNPGLDDATLRQRAIMDVLPISRA